MRERARERERSNQQQRTENEREGERGSSKRKKSRFFFLLLLLLLFFLLLLFSERDLFSYFFWCKEISQRDETKGKKRDFETGIDSEGGSTGGKKKNGKI